MALNHNQSISHEFLKTFGPSNSALSLSSDVIVKDVQGPVAEDVGAPRQRSGGYSVAAVIVTHNRLDLLRECILAVRAQSFGVEDVIVVNNASSDGTLEFLDQNDWPKLRTITLPTNEGGAGGFARGLAEAIRAGADLAWLMDDDCVPDPEALEMLVRSHGSMNAMGVQHSFLCSKAVDPLGAACNQPVPSTGKNPSGWPRWADVAETGCILVDECTFVSALIDCRIAKSVGLPFREMFIWGDDVEYTRRLSAVAPGVFVAASRVLHMRANSGPLDIHTETNATRIQFFRHHYRNRTYLYLKYFDWPRSWYFLLTALGDLAILLARLRLKRASIVARGIWEGLTFRPKVERA
jgi:GT2 family glycosyltransferase